MSEVSERLWRTQVCVVELDMAADRLWVELPGWPYELAIGLQFSTLPRRVQKTAHSPERRYHAHVNIGAEDATELIFKDWELA